MIDESLTSYESVVGMSILDEDGLLPYVVLCEVEDMEMIMGHRGFSGMEVAVRAVGRARRITTTADGVGSSEESRLDTVVGSSTNSYLGRTALDEIHLGQFVEWQDDALDEDQFQTASNYLGNIQSLLLLSSSSDVETTSIGTSPGINDGIQQQQTLFTRDRKSVV